MSTIPTTGIDNYSEEGAVDFEVREAQKGNTARAMLYFYTMYQAEADAADANYFASQRTSLCAWQDADPVDSLEWVAQLEDRQISGGQAKSFCFGLYTSCPHLVRQCPRHVQPDGGHRQRKPVFGSRGLSKPDQRAHQFENDAGKERLGLDFGDGLSGQAGRQLKPQSFPGGEF